VVSEREYWSTYTPRRVISESEYWSAFEPPFQVRIPAGLHDRLCEWAKQERKPPRELVTEILEEAARRREDHA
jgi:hypothetical protein